MEKDLPFEVPCIVNGKPVGGFLQFYPLTVLTTDLFRHSLLRSSLAEPLNNQFRLITQETFVTTTRLTRRLSAMPLTVALLQRKSGRPSLGTIGRPFSLKPRSWLAESIGTGSWPLQCSDRVRMLGKLKLMRQQRSSSFSQSPAKHLSNLCPLAFRLLPFRSEICGGTLFTTTAKELTRDLEVSHRGFFISVYP
jgi:hypothetical protein